jgi:hypothetical protein
MLFLLTFYSTLPMLSRLQLPIQVNRVISLFCGANECSYKEGKGIGDFGLGISDWGFRIGDFGLGISDWGFGIGDLGIGKLGN